MNTTSSVIPGTNTNSVTNTMSGAASRAHSMVDDMAQKAPPAVQSATAAASDHRQGRDGRRQRGGMGRGQRQAAGGQVGGDCGCSLGQVRTR
jgi:hypothetical protein